MSGLEPHVLVVLAGHAQEPNCQFPRTLVLAAAIVTAPEPEQHWKPARGLAQTIAEIERLRIASLDVPVPTALDRHQRGPEARERLEGAGERLTRFRQTCNQGQGFFEE